MTTLNKNTGSRRSPQPAASTSGTNKVPSITSCARTDFALLSLKGALIKAFLRNGTRLEGIFDNFDHGTCSISLRLVRKFSPSDSKEAGSEEATASFTLEEFSWLTSEPVNFAEATGGQAFATDTEISGSSGPFRERELARWEGGESTNALGGLEEEAGPPGVGWDQFDANKRLFGVETSFDEAQYTTVIDRNSEGYRRLEREAERLAAEITCAGTGGTNVHLAEERGAQVDDSQMDEEDRYGAVVRSSPAVPEKSLASKSPTSFREAALSGKASVVTMPKSTTSASDAGKNGHVSGQSSPNLPEKELEAPVPLPPSTRPRKSIANLNVDPNALEQARESVNQATDAMQRRMSQVQVETVKGEQCKKPSLNPNAADFVPGTLFTPRSGTPPAGVGSPAQNIPPPEPTAPSGVNKPIAFNPNAAAYVPSSAPAAPTYGAGPFLNAYGQNPYYAFNPYQQPYVGVGGSGHYSQTPYYNPYQYHHHRYPNQGAYQQQQPVPEQPRSQQKDGTASVLSHGSAPLDQ